MRKLTLEKRPEQATGVIGHTVVYADEDGALHLRQEDGTIEDVGGGGPFQPDQIGDTVIVINEAGGTSVFAYNDQTGNLELSGSGITQLATPQNDTDAATKAYVDAAVGGEAPSAPMSLTDLSDVTGEPAPGYSPVADETSSEFPLTRVVTQEDLDAILALVARVDFHEVGAEGEPPFENDFRNYGLGWAPARWRHAANSVVHLDGVICRDAKLTDATRLFTLPEGSRPDTNLVFLCASENSVSRVDVMSDGGVEWRAYLVGGDSANVYLSLSGISFNRATPQIAEQIVARFA